MNIAAYPTYKRSSVEWLGEIPTHWEVRRLKFLAEVCNGQDQKEVLDDDGKYLIFGSGGPFGHSSQYLYNQPSVLLGRKGTIDKPLYIEEPFWTVDTMFYTRIEPRVFPKYFFYLCKTIPYGYVSDLTTLPSMTQTGLGGVQFAYVEYEEQQQIAAFLDWKTSQIDALIAKKQTLLQKLKEKRLAVITQAVTKGLNPDAPMRDSGIAWLGEVPAHWAVKRLRFGVQRIEQGWSPQCDNQPAEEGEWGVMKVGCVNGDAFNALENKALPPELLALAEYELQPKDILISRANTKELLGSAAIVPPDVRSKLLLCDKLFRLRPEPNIDEEFLTCYLRTPAARYQYEREATGASGSMQNIGQSTLKNLAVPVPPLDEQRLIFEFIQIETSKLDVLMSKANAAITKLTEYRSALITAATTGKIDVRNVAIPAHA